MEEKIVYLYIFRKFFPYGKKKDSLIIDQPPARGLVFLPGLLVLEKLSILRFRRICSLKSTQKCYFLGIETKKSLHKKLNSQQVWNSCSCRFAGWRKKENNLYTDIIGGKKNNILLQVGPEWKKWKNKDKDRQKLNTLGNKD